MYPSEVDLKVIMYLVIWRSVVSVNFLYPPETKSIVQLSIVGGILSSSLFGLAVAGILRSLDNVVKEYSASIANIGTAVLCSYIFPDAFEVRNNELKCLEKSDSLI